MDKLTPPRIFLHELFWDFRKRNTDWRYVRFMLPKLAQFQPDLTLITERSRRVSLRGNLKAIRTAIGRRIGWPLGLYEQTVDTLAREEMVASGCNMIFARSFPLNAGDIPVVWEGGLVDPEMQRGYGISEADLDEEAVVRKKLFERSKVVKLFAEAEQKRHAAMFPDIADRFVAVPWFAPHIHACDAAELEKHRGADPVRILFVGNNAARKRLDQLFDAFLQLPVAVQRRSLLTVISNFDRSNIKVPVHDQIVVLRGAPSERVMMEMRRAHVFVNVAQFESYGLVFHEAMSQGIACLAPNWEVQRELFDYGNAGVLLPCDTDAIRKALERLIEDEDYRYAMGLAAWNRFRENYAPAIVAAKYGALFRSIAATTH